MQLLGGSLCARLSESGGRLLSTSERGGMQDHAEAARPVGAARVWRSYQVMQKGLGTSEASEK